MTKTEIADLDVGDKVRVIREDGEVDIGLVETRRNDLIRLAWLNKTPFMYLSLSEKICELIFRGATVIKAATPQGGWQSVVDQDGNDNLPNDERQVIVFLSGDRKINAPQNNDAGWGYRLGFYDHDKHYWRVDRAPERYVTHWCERPSLPVGAV